MRNTRFSVFVLWLVAFAMPISAQAEAPRVFATVAPLHSLVAQVMEGVAEPGLMLEAAADPHHYALKPSDIQKLESARVVFYVNDKFDFYLRDIKATFPNTQFVAIDAKEKALHPWMSPGKAQGYLTYIAETLSRLDFENAKLYRANALKAKAALQKLELELADTLPVQAKPTIATTHRAFNAYEDYFKLPRSIELAHHHSAGLSPHLLEHAKDKHIACVVVPHGETAGDLRIAEAVKAKLVSLNVMGAEFKPGKDLYPQLLRHVTEKYQECLTAY
jgi:zinc transport system substrate-binding protein